MPARSAIAVVVLAGASLVALGRAEEPSDPAPDRAKIVRAAYAKLPPAVLGIREPIRVTQCSRARVPAYTALMVADADGTNHTFTWWLDKGEKAPDREYDRIFWLSYKGVDATKGKKFRLPARGPEEDALYGLLLRWAAAKEGEKEVAPFDQLMLKEVTGLLGKLDERIAGEKPAPRK